MNSQYQLPPPPPPPIWPLLLYGQLNIKALRHFSNPTGHSVIAIYWPDSFQLDIIIFPIEATPDMLDHVVSVITWLAIITLWTCRYQVNHFPVFFDTRNSVSVIFTSFILIQWWFYMYIPTQMNHYMPGPFLAMWSACVNSRGGGWSSI